MIDVTKIASQGAVTERDRGRGKPVRKAPVEATSEPSWEQDLHPRWVCLPALQVAHRDNGGKGTLTKAVMSDCLNLAQISSPLPKISTHHFC